ncbi:MAG: hypothetical protein R6U98_31105, partial [Pirellulaceae bacterium]
MSRERPNSGAWVFPVLTLSFLAPAWWYLAVNAMWTRNIGMLQPLLHEFITGGIAAPVVGILLSTVCI